jgi:hypothetical protein
VPTTQAFTFHTDTDAGGVFAGQRRYKVVRHDGTEIGHVVRVPHGDGVRWYSEMPDGTTGHNPLYGCETRQAGATLLNACYIDAGGAP